jgi:hypothetical protein
MSWIAVGGAVASAAISYGAKELMKPSGGSGGGSAPLQNFQPSGFNAGGLSSSFSGGNLTIAPTAERLGAVRGLQDTFGNLAGELGGQRARVAPGMSELRAQRLGEIENARTSAIGNLRENLQRRRVLGSSFGQDALSRAESEFAGQKDRVAAESFLQEFELTNQLIGQQFAAQRGQFQTGLDELNLQADLAAKLSTGATTAMSANAKALAELNAKEAAGQGQFIGGLVQPIAKAGGSAIAGSAGSLFSGSSGSSWTPSDATLNASLFPGYGTA